uniref:Reverse transcriptase zinc-binding domain-containing protein n=1 Tax=Arundo donax TaxID=35708 RepID=A0A0A8Z9R2_ARUDO
MSGLINRGGRLILTKVTLTSIPFYLSMSLQLPPWVIRAIDKLRKAFLWKGVGCRLGWPLLGRLA